MKLIRIGLASVFLTMSGAAAAQSASDAGCILASNAFAKAAKDEKGQKLAQASLYFYLGRISGSTTPAQLKTLLQEQAKTMTEATLGTVMNACAKDLQAKIQMIESISEPPPKKPEGR
jgi:aryl-alcohol dehydrogenase-like predicted oxidoreductase